MYQKCLLKCAVVERIKKLENNILIIFVSLFPRMSHISLNIWFVASDLDLKNIRVSFLTKVFFLRGWSQCSKSMNEHNGKNPSTTNS